MKRMYRNAEVGASSFLRQNATTFFKNVVMFCPKRLGVFLKRHDVFGKHEFGINIHLWRHSTGDW
mgnify:CR=1 FL=1